jgi:UDP-glucuronate 4-epimerase
MENQHLLITGGAGFIGSHLVDRLLPRAARVVVIDNFDPFYEAAVKRRNIAEHLKNPAYRLSENDIRDFGSLERLFSEERFDAIVHLAAKAGVRPLWPTRAAISKRMLMVRSICWSWQPARHSRVIFGRPAPSTVRTRSTVSRETVASPFHLCGNQGGRELLAHTYSHLHGIRIVCLRFFTVWRRQRPDLAIHKFARLIDQERPIPVYGDGTSERDYTYIDDIIDGVVAALGYEASDFETINLGESQTVTLSRLIELLEEALGKRALIERLPLQPGDVPRTHADISRARRLLGYNPTTSIEVGIPKFVEWFLQNR